jgi:hypothetical protein
MERSGLKKSPAQQAPGEHRGIELPGWSQEKTRNPALPNGFTF